MLRFKSPQPKPAGGLKNQLTSGGLCPPRRRSSSGQCSIFPAMLGNSLAACSNTPRFATSSNLAGRKISPFPRPFWQFVAANDLPATIQGRLRQELVLIASTTRGLHRQGLAGRSHLLLVDHLNRAAAAAIGFGSGGFGSGHNRRLLVSINWLATEVASPLTG